MSRTKNPNSETIVRGVRAKPNFWEKVNKTAKAENKKTNRFIVEVVDDYCDYQQFKSEKSKKEI